MFKRLLFLSLFVFTFSFLFAQQKSELSLDLIFNSPKFRGHLLSGVQWMPDGQAFVFTKYDRKARHTTLVRYDVATGRESEWIEIPQLKHPVSGEPLPFASYRIAPSGKRLLLKADAKRVWRRPDDGRFFLFDIATQNIRPVYSGKERIRHVKLSPDETMAGYVLEHNLFIKDFKHDLTIQITNDGSDVILNGMGDWVYEEEFSRADCWWWSPDGQKMAFYRFDQSRVPVFSWTEFDEKYGRVRSVHYPKAGEANSVVRIGVYDVNSGRTQWMDIGSNDDMYIPRIYFLKDNRHLLIERMNRLQNKLDFLIADLETGQSRVLFSETDSCWVSVTDDIFFLNDGRRMLKTSEQDGFNHIYLYNLKTGAQKQLTSGKWEVTRVYGVDEKNGLVFFQANKGNIAERQLFRVRLDGTDLRQLTAKPGTHSANFSPDFKYYLHTFSNVETPPVLWLSDAGGEPVRLVRKTEIDALQEFPVAVPEFLSFVTSDGVEIKAMMTKPRDFDPGKKYPVLIYGYSGPASQLVRNSWGRTLSRYWYTLLTQKGYIIFTLDQRGTGGRGKAFKNLAYGDIGKYALRDHIEGVRFLRSLPYVDGNRIGIWGWSGGGYLTCLALTKGADYFKAGVAVAPVTDFRLYDDIWTERYMGMPQQNQAGYDSTSVLSYADRYRSGLLIVHGASDDNVHMQNTMQLIERFEIMDKPFQLMIYPGKNHSLLGGKGSVYPHLYHLITDFILKNL